jgi:cobalt-zinc-cadmium efflux system membrane fusion protein
MKKILIITILFFILSAVVSCGSNETAETSTTEKEGHEDEHENPDIATLTEDQIRSIGIEMGGIEQKQLTRSLKTNGVLRVPNQNKASVNSLYNGVVRSLFVQPGNLVRKGQTIATIANPDFIQVQSEYLSANSRITLAELEVKRQKDLNAGNAGALKNLQSAETALRTLRTTKSTLEQQIQLMGINPEALSNGKLVSELSVKSPISGVVSNVNVKMGSYVDVTTTVAEIVDNSRLHLDLFVYEKDLSKLKNNQTIHFTITNNPGKEYDAEIYSLGSSFEGESKAVTVHAMVEGDKTGLIDGMNVTAVISLNQLTVPAIPNDAIVTVDGKDYIFVLTSSHQEIDTASVGNNGVKHAEEKSSNPEEKEMIFERVPVAKGSTDVGFTEITLLKEIHANAKIVVKGAFFVSAKMTNTEGHHD